MLFNGIMETTGTAGAGPLTLSPVSGRVRFSDFFAASATESQADPFVYAVLSQDSPPQILEIGEGYCSAAGTLERAQIIMSYVAGSVANYPAAPPSLPSGTKTVICTAESASYGTGIPNIPAIPGSFSRRSVGPTHFSGSAVAVSLAKDRLYFCPIYLESPRRVVGLRATMNNIVGVGGTRGLRIGLYSSLRSGAPGRLLMESGDLPSVAYAELYLSFPASRLAAGWYFGALAHDYATTAPNAYGGTAAARQTPLGWSTGNGANRLMGVYQALSAGWGALPTQAAAVASLTAITTAGTPALLLDLE